MLDLVFSDHSSLQILKLISLESLGLIARTKLAKVFSEIGLKKIEMGHGGGRKSLKE